MKDSEVSLSMRMLFMATVLVFSVVVAALGWGQRTAGVMTRIFYDDFDGGGYPEPDPVWTTEDLGSISPAWHPDTFHAWSGQSWWCGQVVREFPALRGYRNGWYHVLDTPSLSLAGYTPPMALTFRSRYRVEPPGAELPPYDGRDGMNVRVSTDGGSTFAVLTPTAFPYTNSSLVSFGEYHCESPGVPGWCGGDDTWGDVSFDLSEYAESSQVVVRFAFASDSVWSTVDDGQGHPRPNAHGWFVDDIAVVAAGGDTIFFDDAEDTTPSGQMNPSNNFGGDDSGGDLWVKTEEESNSPTHSWNCEDSLKMDAVLISPPIDLPMGDDSLGLSFDSLLLSYAVYADLPDYAGGGDDGFEDHWHIDVSTDDGQTWLFFRRDFPQNGLNIGWVRSKTGLTPEGRVAPLDLMPFAGQAIRLRWRLVTDCNDDGGNGEGLYLDDIAVYGLTTPGSILSEVASLKATSGDAYVDLEWSKVGKLIYDDGGFELSQAGNYGGRYWAVRMEGDAGIHRQVDTVWLYVTDPETVSVCGWEDEGPSVDGHRMPGDVLYSLPGAMPSDTGWTAVDVAESGWEFEGGFYVGYLQHEPFKPRLGLDISEPDEGRSVLYRPGFGWNTWSNIVEESPHLTAGNFGIRAGLKMMGGLEVEGYKVLRREEGGGYDSLAMVTETSYRDNTAENVVTYYYRVRPIYNRGTGSLSPEVSATPWGTEYPLWYDDGTAESGLHMGSGNALAVRCILPPELYPVWLVRLDYYIFAGKGNFVATVWDDDGPQGRPSTVLYSNVIAGAVGGQWFRESLEGTADTVWIRDGAFYVGWVETDSTPVLGVDTSDLDPGGSWFQLNGEDWQPLSDVIPVDLMIQALVDTLLSDVEEEVGPERLPDRHELIQNRPNPFNAATEIFYTLPRTSQVRLEVYNLLGRRVRELVVGNEGAGVHRVVWDGRNDRGKRVASGIYLYRLRAGEYEMARRMVLLR